MTRLSRTPTADESWRDCRIGSCHRHEKCMYHPCRNPKPATADDVERAYREGYDDGWSTGTAAMQADREWDCDNSWKNSETYRSRAAIAAMPPADEAIVGRLREALRHAQGRFLNINICLTSGGSKREAIGIADVGEDCIKMLLASLPDTSATVTDGDSARVSDTSGDGV